MNRVVNRLLTPLVLGIGLTLLWTTTAFADGPGDLDPTFNGTGIVTTTISSGDDLAYDIVIQPDDKIVLAGKSERGGIIHDFAVVRYNSDGTLDTSFNSTGIVTTPIGSNFYGIGMALQPDGKIVVIGSDDSQLPFDFAVVRYESDGSLDPTFNSTGIVTTSLGSDYGHGHAVTIQPDGKIVVAGESGQILGRRDLAVVRYLDNGALDTSFNGTGIVTTSIGSSFGTSLLVQPDDKLLVAGTAGDYPDRDVVLVRYESDGSLDPTFDSTGVVTTPVGSGDDLGFSLALRPNGKIVVAGASHNGTDYDFAVVRYHSDGSLDPTFNSTGIVTTPIGTLDDFGTRVAIQSNGKVLVSGETNNGSNRDFALVRYRSDGALDPTFNSTGIVTTPLGSSDFNILFGTAVALQSDRRIVVAGSSDASGDFDFAVVRYAGDRLSYLPIILKH